MNHKKILLTVLCVLILAAGLSAQLPDWFIDPPMAEDRLFGIGFGSTEFEAVVWAIYDIAFQSQTSVETHQINNEYIYFYQKTTWRGPNYVLHSTVMDSPTLGNFSNLFLEVRDHQSGRAGAFLWRGFQSSDEDSEEERTIEHAGPIEDDEALSLLKRNPASWTDERHPCIEVIEVVRDRKSNKPLYYALVAVETPEY